jgi:phosphatidylserine/phosphatidylglycerophosphate/cardiolipin synthase-like enzyme
MRRFIQKRLWAGILIGCLIVCDSLAAPKLLVQPRDGIAPIISAINAAKRSIRHKIYLFTDSRQDVIAALSDATKRGVDVKILLEREPSGTSGGNTAIFLRLREAGLNVKLTKPFEFVFIHEKSFVIDDQIGIISTANITASSYSANREYQVVLNDTERVSEMARVFDADWNGQQIDLSTAKLIWSPSVTTSSGLVRGNARARILELIRSASTSLLLEQAGMADEEVIREIEAASRRGVNVTLIGSPADPTTDTYFVVGAERLRKAGVRLRYLLTNYVHAKVIVADGERALIGSINISANSIDANRELSVILTRTEAPDALRDLIATLEADAQRGVEVNPFSLPPLETIQPAERMAEFIGRIVTLEGTVTEVQKFPAVAFLKFGSGATAPRAVVFSRSFDAFPQPFPDVFLAKKVRITGRVQLYGDYYEVILNGPDQIQFSP